VNTLGLLDLGLFDFIFFALAAMSVAQAVWEIAQIPPVRWVFTGLAWLEVLEWRDPAPMCAQGRKLVALLVAAGATIWIAAAVRRVA
jgi:hypothetical protein